MDTERKFSEHAGRWSLVAGAVAAGATCYFGIDRLFGDLVGISRWFVASAIGLIFAAGWLQASLRQEAVRRIADGEVTNP